MEPRVCIASHASESDYVPTSRALLWKLGYSLVPAEEAEAPELRVVREDRLGELPEHAAAPIILITTGRQAKRGGKHVVGTVRRPAGLHELYRLIQAALEETPRSVPRVPASLEARATSETNEWKLTVESLSENGCLVAGPMLPPLDTQLELRIELPWGESVDATAVAAYEQGGRLGLVFHGITLGARKQLAKTVLKLLQRQ
jgi:hypothetical protein